jgi:hypothetical protein
MSRRVGIVALVTVALIAVAAVDADAHYTYVSGKLVYHSLTCEEVLKGVKNPDTNPSRVDCIVTSTLVETLCVNPNFHDVQPGESATQVTVFGSELLSSENFDKKKGTATATVLIPLADDLGLTNEVCVNPNWHLIKAIIRSATVHLDAYACGPDQTCNTTDDVLASTTTLQCFLPAGVDFDDFGENSQPLNPIEFDCPPGLASTTHVK